MALVPNETAAKAAEVASSQTNLLELFIQIATFSLSATFVLYLIILMVDKYKERQVKKKEGSFGILAVLKTAREFFQNKKCEQCAFASGYQLLVEENKMLQEKSAVNYELFAVAEALKNFGVGMAVDVNGNIVIDGKTIEDIRSVGIGLQSIIGVVDTSKAPVSNASFYLIDRLKEKVVRKI